MANNYTIMTLRTKNADGSFTAYHPVTGLDSIVVDENNTKLSTKFTNSGNSYSGTAANASSVPWSGIKNAPNTLAGYGITDAVKSSDVADTATANKLLKLNANAKFPATILDGVIPIENIPHGALERCVVVANDTARFALTTDNVQTGDTVKVTETGMMYFVVDDTQLNVEAGYEIYCAGSASAVSWAGITDKPTTLLGFGITDAVNSSDVTTTATANKLLKLNSAGKLPASITGDADTVDGKHATDFALSSDVTTTATANKLLKLNADAKLPADITGNAASASSVAWANVSGKPTTLSGYGITDAVASSEVVTTATANKLLKLDASGKLPTSITGAAATADKLTAGRTISLSGDASGSVTFDGSKDVSITVTVADDSHAHVIDNVDGLQTALNAKAPLASPTFTGTPAAPTANAGTNTTQIATTAFVTTAVSNATTTLNNAINGKQATITGGATTITSDDLSANRALISNGFGKVVVSDITSTELSYLDNVTSNIQTQLNNRVLTSDVVTTATANKILKLGSNGKFPVAAIPQPVEFITYTTADI